MSKYIDAERLKYEIERRRLSNQYTDTEGYENELLDIIDSLQQEQPEVPSGEDVMVMCNQILIDWVKEGNTQEEKEQREQAHIRFFELYDNYLMQEQPEIDLREFINKIDSFKARYKHPESISIKGAMAFMARMFYQYPNTAREWYESLPKATMDNARKEE